MRPSLIARLLLAAGALAVAVALVGLERDRDRCQEALRATFLASQGPEPALDRRADALVRECEGAEPLVQIAAGLRETRPRVAARLARAGAAREPDSYVAWGVLAVAAPRPEAERAARRARALNPLSSAGAGP
jgi:hypothetical protein